jgi:hypothetical protein
MSKRYFGKCFLHCYWVSIEGLLRAQGGPGLDLGCLPSSHTLSPGLLPCSPGSRHLTDLLSGTGPLHSSGPQLFLWTIPIPLDHSYSSGPQLFLWTTSRPHLFFWAAAIPLDHSISLPSGTSQDPSIPLSHSNSSAPLPFFWTTSIPMDYSTPTGDVPLR